MAIAMTKKEKKICRDAAEILASKDHARNYYGDGENSVCMMGAIFLASGMKLEDYPVGSSTMLNSGDTPEVEKLLSKSVFGDIYKVCEVNNRSTKEECVELLLAMSA